MSSEEDPQVNEKDGEEGEEKDKGEEKRRGLWQRGGGGCGKRERSERDANFNSSTIVMR